MKEMQDLKNAGNKMPDDIMEAKREELVSIDVINMEKKQPPEKRSESLSQIEGDVSTHLNEDYVVRVHFSEDDYSATDALKQYLRQIAELKY